MIDMQLLEAIAICYGPLALVIIGFVAAALLTDGDSRRTYLRRFPSRDGHGPRELTEPLTAETPARVTVTILPDESVKSRSEVAPLLAPAQPKSLGVPAPTAMTAPPAEAAPVPAPVSDEPDDLTRIEGIGPKMAEALIAAGLDTFEKVAAASIEDFQAAIEQAGMRFAPAAESWAEQASYAAKGDWDGLARLQDTLISGRYPTDNE
ncbi:hypothetical protein HC928_25775 [bacterium]|nr:hypothetical protein [bacterium]